MRQADITKLANKLNYLAVQAYLTHTGWSKKNSKRDGVGIFRKEKKDESYEILLPLAKDFVDYTPQIIKAIQILADYENKNFEELLSDLNLCPFDVLRFRVQNVDTEEGTISFDEGYNLLTNAKKVLYAAASDIIQPEAYHKRLSFKTADQFIEKCRLGQTERGSFIASVVCPFVNNDIDDHVTQLSLFAETEEFISSFTRKVTTQVMKSVEAVKKAVETNAVESFLNGELGVKVSGNFLESLIDLNELNEDGEINIISSWSTVAPSNINTPNSVSLTKEYVPAIQSIINRVRPVIIDRQGEYVGKISGNQAEPDANKREKGEVIFTFIEDEKAVKAKVVNLASNKIESQEKLVKLFIGKKVVIEKDTLLIIDYSTFNNTYKLSNGIEYDMDFVKSKLTTNENP